MQPSPTTRIALENPRPSANVTAAPLPAGVASKLDVVNLQFWYGQAQALKNITMSIGANMVTAIIGPSGCGKSTLLRCFNRMHDLYPGNRYVGRVLLQPEGRNIISPQVDATEIRMRISMVFQKPNPFPKSIAENIAYGLRLKGLTDKRELADRTEHVLKNVGLWDEVKDRLQKSAYHLSGGQQQRLCIARAMATEPEILLMDEPTSAIDPIATHRIEELILAIKHDITIIIVTHNMQQAARVSDQTAFLYLGELVEAGPTVQLFQSPTSKLTSDYIAGHFG